MAARGNNRKPRAAGRTEPTRRRPYLERLARRGPLYVWLVDGSYIRTAKEIEFSNFGQHYDFPSLIPRNEIWLDYEADPDEHAFFIAHAVLERRLRAQGADPEVARRKANARERALRAATGDLRKVLGDRELPQVDRVHVSLWKQLTGGPSVWFVDGRLVRSAFDVEFTAGGHAHVYEFVPDHEIWIDDDIHEDERAFVLFHELHEHSLMALGMDYDTAHAEASTRERYLRKHPAELHQALVDEGWE